MLICSYAPIVLSQPYFKVTVVKVIMEDVRISGMKKQEDQLQSDETLISSPNIQKDSNSRARRSVRIIVFKAFLWGVETSCFAPRL